MDLHQPIRTHHVPAAVVERVGRRTFREIAVRTAAYDAETVRLAIGVAWPYGILGPQTPDAPPTLPYESRRERRARAARRRRRR